MYWTKMLNLKTNDKSFGYIILEISYLNQIFCIVGHLREFNVRCALWMPRLWYQVSYNVFNPRTPLFFPAHIGISWDWFCRQIPRDDTYTHNEVWLFDSSDLLVHREETDTRAFLFGQSVWFQCPRICAPARVQPSVCLTLRSCRL